MKINNIMVVAVIFCLFLNGCVSFTNVSTNDSVQLRCISYNVEYGKSATSRDFGLMLKSFKPDIVGFNEAPAGRWIEEVGKAAGMKYYYVGKISSANHKDKYKSILSRTELFDTKEYLITGHGWNPCSVVHAKTKIDGVEISVYSTHVCANTAMGKDGKFKYRGHTDDISDNVLAKDTCKRIVLMGDLNVSVGSPALSVLEKQMRVCWRDLDLDLKKEFTWPTKLRKSGEPKLIDHILVNRASKARFVSGGIIELEKPLSDHKPIWAEITFPNCGDRDE